MEVYNYIIHWKFGLTYNYGSIIPFNNKENQQKLGLHATTVATSTHYIKMPHLCVRDPFNQGHVSFVKSQICVRSEQTFRIDQFNIHNILVCTQPFTRWHHMYLKYMLVCTRMS